MTYTFQDVTTLSSRLQRVNENQYAQSVGKILAAAANICESTNGLEIAAGMRGDREDFYAEVLDSICNELTTTLKAALNPEMLNWFFSSDSEHEPEEEAITSELEEEGEEELTPNQIKILKTTKEIAEELGSSTEISRENYLNIVLEIKSRIITRRLAILRRKRFLDRAHDKMQLIVIPLLRMALEKDSIDEDGNSNEDKDTLIQAGIEILDQALRLTRGIEEYE